MVGYFIVHSIKHCFNRRFLLNCRRFKGKSGCLPGMSSILLRVTFLKKTFFQHIFFKSDDWIAHFLEQILPFLHFLGVSVCLREVTGGVVADSVWHSFDQSWSFVSDDHLPCLLGCSIDSKDIIAVYPDGWNTVGDTSHSDTVTCILVINWGRDSIHVISAVE